MLKALVRTYYKGNGGLSLVQAIKTGRSKNGKRRKGVGILSYLGLFYLSLLYMWMIYSNFVSQLRQSVGLALISIQGLGLMLSIFFTLTSVDNVLVSGKDLDTLKTLPIDNKTLTLSRFLILYIEVFIESILVIIPFIIACLLNTRFSILFYLLIIADAFVIPFFSAFFMGVFSYLSQKSIVIKRIKTILIYALSLFLVYFMLRVLGKQAGPNAAITLVLNDKVSITNEILILFSLIIFFLAVAGLALYFISLSLSIAVAESEGIKEDVKAHNKEISFKKSSVIKALMMREKRIMFSSSSFSTELILELVMPLFIIVIYALMGILGDMSKDIMSIPGIEKYIHLVLWGIILMFYTFNMLSSTSVSREGKDFDYSRTLPVNEKQRVKAKLYFHMLLTIPCIDLFIIAVAIFTRAPLIETILVLFSSIFYIAGISAVGLAIDYKKPHTEWERPQEAVKQNLNGLGAMGINLIQLIIIVSLVVLCEIYIKVRVASLIIPSLVSIIFFLIFSKLAFANAKKQYTF